MAQQLDADAEGGCALLNDDAGIDTAAIAEESRSERASDHAASSSVIYRDSCWGWTGTWMAPMVVVVVASSQRSVEHGQQGFVSSFPPQLFPLTLVEPSQELHYRKQRAPDAALQERYPYPRISACQR